jgi:CTP:molybdopterin cytidylyltransferase MocA
VACRHDGLLRTFPVANAAELADVDTRADLMAVEARLREPDR